MKSSVVGIYQNHQDAVAAVSELQKGGYDVKKISLFGKADLVNDHITVKSGDATEKTEMSIGVVAGTILGVLTGMSILAIPGFGFVFGTGALVGAVVGFDVGVVGGGLAAILTSLGMSGHLAAQYEQSLKDGKFVVFIQGSDEELDKAQHILHTGGLHMELDRN